MFESLKEALVWIASVLTSLTVIYGAYEKFVKKKFDSIDKKINDNADRVKTLEDKHDEEVRSVKESIQSNYAKLLNDNESLLKQQEMNGIIMRSLSAVTHHLVDGNHQIQLEQSAKEIDGFLFEKAKKIKE